RNILNCLDGAVTRQFAADVDGDVVMPRRQLLEVKIPLGVRCVRRIAYRRRFIAAVRGNPQSRRRLARIRIHNFAAEAAGGAKLDDQRLTLVRVGYSGRVVQSDLGESLVAGFQWGQTIIQKTRNQTLALLIAGAPEHLPELLGKLNVVEGRR